MSSLLNDAIVDAKALRESALKNAEAAVVDKYADEVKSVLDQLLEQEEGEALESPDLGLDLEAPTMDAPGGVEETIGEQEEVTEDEVPLAATDGFAENEGQNLSSLPNAGEDVEINIDLGALQEAIASL